MPKRRTRKRSRKKDRISKLPDDVLCHILSFIPTEEAIATSMLSTRWRFLWTMVPALDFKLTKPTTYLKINKFLCLRKIQKITRFHLDLTRGCVPPNANKWVFAAINRKVEELKISFDKRMFNLESTLFNCNTLVILKLTIPYCSYFPFPYTHLPCVKTFHLHMPRQCECVPLSCLKNLIYGCPALELFHYKHKCAYKNELNTTHVLCYNELNIVCSSGSTRVMEHSDKHNIVVKSKRTYNSITDYLRGEWENMVKSKVKIKVLSAISSSLLESNMLKILKSIRNVEILSLTDFRARVHNSDHFERYGFDSLPQFGNLVQLRLHLKNPNSGLTKLPEKCPKLQSVELVIMDNKKDKGSDFGNVFTLLLLFLRFSVTLLYVILFLYLVSGL